MQLSKHFLTTSKSDPDGSGSGGLNAGGGSAYLEG